MPTTTIDNTPAALIRLRTAVQQYPWGKHGSSSLAAHLAQNSVGPDFSIDESKAYAEVRSPNRIYPDVHSSTCSDLDGHPSQRALHALRRA